MPWLPTASSRPPSSAGTGERGSLAIDLTVADHPRVCVVGSLHFDIMVRAPYLPRTGETLIGDAWWWKQGGKGGQPGGGRRSPRRGGADGRLPR